MNSKKILPIIMCGFGLLSVIGATSCQTTVGGQNLPSPYYLDDDVQYFPAGPEFKLSREAAAMKQYEAEQRVLNQ